MLALRAPFQVRLSRERPDSFLPSVPDILHFPLGSFCACRVAVSRPHSRVRGVHTPPEVPPGGKGRRMCAYTREYQGATGLDGSPPPPPSEGHTPLRRVRRLMAPTCVLSWRGSVASALKRVSDGPRRSSRRSNGCWRLSNGWPTGSSVMCSLRYICAQP